MKLFTFFFRIGFLLILSFSSFAADMKNYDSNIKEISVKYQVFKSFQGMEKDYKSLKITMKTAEKSGSQRFKEDLSFFITINSNEEWPIFYTTIVDRNDGNVVLYIFCRTKDLKHDIALIVEEKEALFILKNRSEIIKDIQKNLMKKIELKDIEENTNNYDSPFELKNIEEYRKKNIKPIDIKFLD